MNDGGPAFPFSVNAHNYSHECEGMSLRDWFAGQALCARALHGLDLTYKSRGEALEEVATQCYEFADAMLKARENKK